jgi:hypothetical protein
VTVSLDGAPPLRATASATGAWRVTLPPTAGSATPHSLRAASGADAVELSDVLFGDLILFSGQSNVCFTLNQSFGGPAEVAAAAHPLLRIATLATNSTAREPAADVRLAQPWAASTPESVLGPAFGYFSAIAYYTGRDLMQVRGAAAVPLGLLVDAVGGTIISQWSPPAVLAGCNNSGSPPLPLPGGIYNGMVAPLAAGPLALAAVVWLQGESNVDRVGAQQGPAYYDCMLAPLISSWRAAFARPALPWLEIELAPYMEKQPDPALLYLPGVRDAQANASARLAGVFFVGTHDAGDMLSPPGDVHPRNKSVVGARAAAALAAALDGTAPPGGSLGARFASQSPPRAVGATLVVSVRLSGLGPGGIDVIEPAPCQVVPPFNDSYCGYPLVELSDGSLARATLAASASERDVVDFTIAQPAAGVVPVATRYAFNSWPVSSLYSGAFPVFPWYRAIPAQGEV